MTNSLAIIIPYYKLTFFRETLESLAAQTDQRFTVYIGNDASSENPEELLKEFEGKFNFIYKKFEQNLGGISLTKQWERCIEMMQHEEWFMILGDDDVLAANVIREFYRNHEVFKNRTNVVRFSTVVINDKSEEISSPYLHPIYEDPTESFMRKITGKTRSSLSEYVFRTVAYQKIGFVHLNLAWGTDDLAALEFPEEKKIFSINNAVVYFRMSQENITGKKDNFIVKNRTNIEKIKFVLKNKKKDFIGDRTKQCLDYLNFYTFSLPKNDLNSFIKLVFLHIQYGTYSSTLDILKVIIFKILF